MSAETMGGGAGDGGWRPGARDGAGSFWGRRGKLGEAVVGLAKGLLEVKFSREEPCQGSLFNVRAGGAGGAHVCAACARCTLRAGTEVRQPGARLSLFSLGARC